MKNSDKRFWLFIVLIFALLIFAKASKAQITSIPTIEEIKIELAKQKVKHADIVLRQAILETGWLSCTKCSLKYNNLFGFWYKKQYLKFDNWKESIAYYRRWQDRHFKGGDYYQFLVDRGYATDPEYINKLKSINI